MIIWFLFVILSSILEAYIFNKNKFKTKYKHYILTAIRGIICLPIAYLNNEPFIFFLFSLFTFSFIHDGIYYTTRHLLNKNVYPKMFFDRSTTTTAIISLSIFWRLILFIFGLGLLPVIV